MESAVPPTFDEAFLDWFRERTEATWSKYPPPTLKRFAQHRRLGCDWQLGTRWLGGLAEEQVAAVEREWGLRFPPDYRLFLSRLHAVDHPLRCTGWAESATGAPPTQTLHDEPAFYNWLTEGDILQKRCDDLVGGLQFDVEEAGLWRPAWGTRPATAEARAQRLRALVAGAPRLLPVFSHRYLLAEPCLPSNPVFSIVQSDIIVYGVDLRTYFLTEFADLLGIDQDAARKDVAGAIQARSPIYAAIPFWGDLYAS